MSNQHKTDNELLNKSINATPILQDYEPDRTCQKCKGQRGAYCWVDGQLVRLCPDCYREIK